MLDGWISAGSRGSMPSRPSASSARRSRSESSTILRVPGAPREQTELGAELGDARARLRERQSLAADPALAVDELDVHAGAVDADEQGPHGGQAPADAERDARDDLAARVVEVIEPVALEVRERVGAGGGEVVGRDVGDALVVGEDDLVGTEPDEGGVGSDAQEG